MSGRDDGARLCIHGHFYQPPRENPWLEAIEREDSARPYHDWNERIAAECYEPNTAARVLDSRGRIARIVNNYERLSFNVGPTLMAWLEGRSPEAYRSILAADRRVLERDGHGAALAQPYNHMILPLASPRDRRTQVVWGVSDFERRFGRRPQGMWLPETAVDLDSLEALAEAGIRFTILAPHQAARVRPLEGAAWEEVGSGGVDTSRPYLQRLPSGREIVLFFYHGPLSTAVAFEHLLDDGEAFASRLLEAARGTEGLLHLASDGETYGHHHRHGEMALAYALERAAAAGLRPTTYAAWLERYPPVHEVEVAEQTSWSCAHGVERWRSDCGCRTGARPEWSQAWRAPLRSALDWLRDELASHYARAAAGTLREPWAARDDYIQVILDRSEPSLDRFFDRHAEAAGPAERSQALRLLEMQRHAMLMYTSCGWFFDDVGGIETGQVLAYAARAVQLAEAALGVRLEPELLERLEAARSNDPEVGDARLAYRTRVAPRRLSLARVAAHHAAGTAFGGIAPRLTGEAYSVEASARSGVELELGRLETGRLRVRSRVTLEEEVFHFAALFHGRYGVSGGLRAGDEDPDAFRRAAAAVEGAHRTGDVPAALRCLDEGFPVEPFSLDSLLPDERRFLVGRFLEERLAGELAMHREIFERDAALMRTAAAAGLPLPAPFRASAGVVLNAGLRRALGEEADPEHAAGLLARARELGVELEDERLAFVLRRTLEGVIEGLTGSLTETPEVERLLTFVELAGALPFEVDLWRVQNRAYALMRSVWPVRRRKGEAGESTAALWARRFAELCEQLGLAVPEEAAAEG